MDIPRPSDPQIPPAAIESFPGTRLITYSPRSFHDVTERLYRAIGFHPSWSSSTPAVANTPDTPMVPPVAMWSGIMERDRRLQQVGKPVEERLEIFQEGVKVVLGPHGFMFFAEIDYGSWMPFFMPSSSNASEAEENKKPTFTRQCKRIILGNPLIAITMLQHDLNAGLALPVELLLVEQDKKDEEGEKGKTRIVYQLPSALIVRINTNPQSKGAAEKLDEKLAALVKHIAF